MDAETNAVTVLPDGGEMVFDNPSKPQYAIFDTGMPKITIPQQLCDAAIYYFGNHTDATEVVLDFVMHGKNDDDMKTLKKNNADENLW